MHVLPDAAGLPLLVGVSAADTHDSQALKPMRLADALSDPLRRVAGGDELAPWLPNATAGENWFADLLKRQGKFGARQPDTLTETPLGKRYPDHIEERADASTSPTR